MPGALRNPFPKLTAEARRHPENKGLLDELGAYFTSVVTHKPRSAKAKRYDFYEYLDEQEGEDDGLERQARSG